MQDTEGETKKDDVEMATSESETAAKENGSVESPDTVADTTSDGTVSKENVQTIEDILDTKSSKFKSIEVFKEVDPIIDTGNLFLHDLQPIDVKKFRGQTEEMLNQIARDNAQLLFNEIWKLPIEKVGNVVTCTLPPPTSILPREKKIPKAKPPTKWEQFAAKKGIANKKRGRMIFDEASKTWKPRFGYNRANDDTKEWCIEVPEGADPNEDQFEKRVKAKKERVAKNELQRLQNIQRNSKAAAATGGNAKPDNKQIKAELSRDIDIAKTSTASLGKFQERLPKEKENKRGKKRTFESVTGNSQSEKDRALDVWNKLNTKKPMLDITKGVNKHIHEEQRSEAMKKKGGKGGGKSGKVKNQRFKKGAQAVADKKKQKKMGKGKTLGKRKK